MDFSSLKKDDLLKIAKEKGIKVNSKMTKEEIISLLESVKSAEESSKTKKKVVESKISTKGKKVKTKEILESIEHTIEGVVSSAPQYETKTVYFVEPTKELPYEYGDTKITFLVQDPYWTHVYWEISHSKREELGLLPRGEHGKQLVIRVYDVTGVESVFNGLNANSFFDVYVNDYTNNWYINVPEYDRSYCADLGVIIDGKFVVIARSNIIKVPRGSVSPYYDEEWMIVTDDILKASGLGVLHEVVGSAMMIRALELPFNISSAEFVSSFAIPERPPKEKGFWLEVHTELTVYGQTEPDAIVTIFGERIKLDKDGKFYLKMYLPDGIRNIPIVGTSSDGTHTISVIPIVEKKTERYEDIKK
ncbi:MAG: DUF4912 domain-containing protein [Brevinematia bacterium]